MFLLRNPGRLIKKDEFLNPVWNDCSVSDNSLTRSIATLRRLLGDDSPQPRYIATVQTFGYRFLADVEAIEDFNAIGPVSPKLTPPMNDIGTNIHRRWLVRVAFLIGVVLALSALSMLLWKFRMRLVANAEIAEQQLTRNSNDNPLFDVAISGDGKYLAFSDSLGIHVKLLQTGETHDITQPPEFGDALVFWRVLWLPDSTRFLAVFLRNGLPPITWQVSVIGGTLRKLREDALAKSVIVKRSSSYRIAMASGDSTVSL